MLPNTVTRIEDGENVVVPLSQLVAGDRVSVKAGDAIPADGFLVTRAASVDEALLTGEARPQAKSSGDMLVAGSINLDSMIEMHVEKNRPRYDAWHDQPAQ